jgi:hypothetical protein
MTAKKTAIQQLLLSNGFTSMFAWQQLKTTGGMVFSVQSVPRCYIT